MEDYKSVLKRLVAVDTQNPPGNESDLVKVILELTGSRDYKIVEHGNNRSSLVLEIRGEDLSKAVGFAGHMDTVPVGGRGKWTHDPFGGDEKDGYMYGRGTTDMRGGIAVMVMLYRFFSKKKPPVTLKFFFTADEEADGLGARTMQKEGCFDGLSALFVCEPSDCRAGLSEKGTVWLEVSVTGKSSHAARPELGVNAVENGFEFLNQLKGMIEDMPAHPQLGKTTFSVTGVSAGVKINIIPDKASFLVDIRTTPNNFKNNAELISLVKQKASEFCGQKNLGIEFKVLNDRQALMISEDDNLVVKLKETFKSLNMPFQKCGINFYTDASLIVPFTNVPFVILGPGDPDECHMTDEKIELKSIEKTFEIYRELVLNITE